MGPKGHEEQRALEYMALCFYFYAIFRLAFAGILLKGVNIRWHKPLDSLAKSWARHYTNVWRACGLAESWRSCNFKSKLMQQTAEVLDKKFAADFPRAENIDPVIPRWAAQVLAEFVNKSHVLQKAKSD